MSRRANDRFARLLGLGAGAAVAAATLIAWQVPATGHTAGAELRVSVQATGELATEPTGTVIAARDLRAGGQVRGKFELRNQTGRQLAVRLRVRGSDGGVDGVRLNLHVGDKSLAGGSLERVLRGPSRTFVLGPRERAAVSVDIELPRSTRAVAARAVALQIEPQSEVVER